MTTLSIPQITQVARNAGFTGVALVTAVAIALAESGGNPQAYNPEDAAGTAPGHGSRGLWQIYGTAHPLYDNTAAFDPQTNANEAYAVYKAAGNSFRPWSTFGSGAYQKFTGQVTKALGALPANPSGSGLDFSSVREQLAWWLAPAPAGTNPHGNGFANVSQMYGQNGETGIDIAMPYHTPVYALASGPVSGIDSYPGGLVVTTDIASDKALYYQHLSDIVVAKGQQVAAGQLLGYSGGQVGYGDNPSTRQFSSGPHIEVGVNWWHSLGKNGNPLSLLQTMLAGYSAQNVPTSFVGSSSGASAVALSSQSAQCGPGIWFMHDTTQPSGVLCAYLAADLSAASRFPCASAACLGGLAGAASQVPGVQGAATDVQALGQIATELSGIGQVIGALIPWMLNPLRIVELFAAFGLMTAAMLIAFRAPIGQVVKTATDIAAASA